MSRQLSIDTMYFPTIGYALASPAKAANYYFLTARYSTWTERNITYESAGVVFYSHSRTDLIITPLISIPRSHFNADTMEIG